MTLREVSGHGSRPLHHDAEAGALSHRSALLARRDAAFRNALGSAEVALARGAGDDALQAAVEAGLLEPDDDRVIAVLDQAQDRLGADPSAVTFTFVTPQTLRGRSVGPASWSLGTPELGRNGTGRRARMASIRRARGSGGMELPPGIEPGTPAILADAGRSKQGEVNRPPRLLRSVPPIYPAAAFDRGLDGVMTVVGPPTAPPTGSLGGPSRPASRS